MVETDNNHSVCYAFGDYQLTVGPRALYCNGKPIDASDRMTRLLLALVQHPGEVAGKYDLIDQLWPDQEVSEWSLSRLVSDTRQLLGDSGDDQGLIQTVRGKGFRLNPDVVVAITEPPPARAPLPVLRSARRKTVLAAAAAIVLLAVVVWRVWDSSRQPSSQEDLHLLVLPIDVQTGDDQDSWVEYGVMTVLTGQLQRFPELQVAEVGATLRALDQIGYRDEITRDELFERVCLPLGCDKLVAVDLSLNDSGIPVLQYQLHESSKRSQAYRFTNEDVLLASNNLFEHLLQQLLPPQPERVVVDGMYTDDIRANRNFALGASSVLEGDYDSAENYLEMALEQKPDYFWAQAYMSDAYARNGKHMEAEAIIDDLAASATDRRHLLFLEKVRSSISHERGDLERSIVQARNMLDLAIELGDRQAEGLAHMNIGATLQSMGDNLAARDSLNRALEVFRQQGYRLREAQTTYNIGNVHYALAEFEAAEKNYQAAADMFRKLGATQYLSFVQYALSGLKMSLGRLDQAEKEFLEVQKLYRDLGDTEGVLLVYGELGTIELLRGNLENAESLLLGAYEQAGNTYTFVRSWISGLLAINYLNMGRPAMAKPYIDERERFGWFDARVPMAFVAASFAHASGDYAGAVRDAEAIRVRIGTQWTDQHDDWLRAFHESAASGEPGITNYYRLATK